MELTAIDICGGAGGWAIAARGLPIRIIATIDRAEDCCATYHYNHPQVEVICADLLNIEPTRFAGVDVVLGAVPCEEISVARHGCGILKNSDLHDWHTLLDGSLACVEKIGPRFWCLENVQQMRRHLPPLTPYVIMHAAEFSGQARTRIFVGKFPTVRPLGDNTTLSDYLLPGPYTISPKTLAATRISHRQWYEKDTKRLLRLDRKSPTITDFGSRHSRGFCVAMEDGRERTLQFTEAAAIQGFPSNYVFVCSLSRAWKMVAQAIPISLGRAILRAMCDSVQTRATCGK
jgi:site-specific DNA-cytosine methylase